MMVFMVFVMIFSLQGMDDNLWQACAGLLKLQESSAKNSETLVKYDFKKIQGASCYTRAYATKTYTKYKKVDNINNALPASYFLCNRCKKAVASQESIETHCKECK